MITSIGNIIIEQLKNLSFVDKYAGVVRPVSYSDPSGQDGRIIKKIFPLSCSVDPTDSNLQKLKDLCPDTSKKSVMYLEDRPMRFIKQDGKRFYFQAIYDLVLWLNVPLLGSMDCNMSAKAMMAILSKLNSGAINQPPFLNLWMTPLGEESKSKNPFSKYSYDVEQSQVLMYPFDYLVLPIQVDFFVTKECLNDFNVGTPLNCLQTGGSECLATPIPSPSLTCATIAQCQAIIDIIASITNEAEARTEADAALQALYEELNLTVENLDTAISNEITNREAADNTLQGEIDDLQQQIDNFQPPAQSFPFINQNSIVCFHGLGRNVEVAIWDDLGNKILGEAIRDIGNPLNQIIINFNQPLTGTILIQ